MDDTKLIEAINQAVVDKTMSLDGLKAVQEIKARLETADRQLIDVRQVRDEYLKSFKEAQSQIAAQVAQIDGLRARILGYEQRDAQTTEALLSAKYAEYRRADIFALVQTIFRNPIVKSEIIQSETIPVTVSQSGGGSYISSQTATKTTATKQETE